MIFYLLIQLFVLYEIWKLTKFHYNFRLICIFYDYTESIMKKINSVAYKEYMKINFLELIYSITSIYGLFKKNYTLFFAFLFIITLIKSFIFKMIKNKNVRKTTFIIDIILTVITLILVLINIRYFNINEIQLIKNIF